MAQHDKNRHAGTDADAAVLPFETGEVERPSPSSLPAARETKLHSIMTQPVRCVRPELNLGALLGLFFEYGISAAPVVDAEGKAIGIVSKTDLLRRLEAAAGTRELDARPESAAAAARASRALVGDVMTHLTYSLGPDASVSRAAALMAYEGVHRIVIATPDGAPIGIVSALDVLRWLARREGYVIPDRTRAQGESKAS